MASDEPGYTENAEPRGRTMIHWWAHNLIAHPLLVLCPPLGAWLHDRTIPEDAALTQGDPDGQ